MKRSRQQTERIWREHVEAAEHYLGTAADYCRSAGIDTTSFYLWRSKLKRERVSAFLPAVVTEAAQISSRVESRSLPDPKWLGEMLSWLLRGL